MQAAELRREADLVAPRDRRLGGDAGDGDAVAADPGFEQDLGAELFDDFDAGIFALLGIRGQIIFVDPASKLVMVHTAVRKNPSDSNAEAVTLWLHVVAQLGK
jgi:CubicO group peptidase (beta-lactamase class C family)